MKKKKLHTDGLHARYVGQLWHTDHDYLEEAQKVVGYENKK
jgi:hypothetical protein